MMKLVFIKVKQYIQGNIASNDKTQNLFLS